MSENGRGVLKTSYLCGHLAILYCERCGSTFHRRTGEKALIEMFPFLHHVDAKQSPVNCNKAGLYLVQKHQYSAVRNIRIETGA